jgi:hypothetical protein
MRRKIMAYLNFSEFQSTDATTTAGVAEPMRSFSALEWSVVAIARGDSIASLGRPGRTAMALGVIFGGARPNPKLADGKLEALRRMAVLAWHRGYTVANSELRAFFAAGFSHDQYETLQGSIGQARAAGKQRNFR